MANPVWVWINCHAGSEQAAAGALRASFERANIADQLLDLILPPADWAPQAQPGLDELDELMPPNPTLQQINDRGFTSRIMIKVARTPAAAAVLREGYSYTGQPGAYWSFSRVVRQGVQAPDGTQTAPLPGAPGLEKGSNVRILSWPFEGFGGRVTHVDHKQGWVYLFITGRTGVIAVQTGEVLRDYGNEEPRRAWYILYGYAGKESVLRDRMRQRLDQAGLLDRLYDVIIPAEGQGSITMLRDGQVRTVYPTLYPGAVFVLASLTDDVWSILRQTPGLTGFVGTGDRPLPYTPTLSAPMQIPSGQEPPAPAQKGELVRILTGPFRDFRGTVIEIDPERAHLRVMIDFFNRPTPVEVGYEQVRKE